MMVLKEPLIRKRLINTSHLFQKGCSLALENAGEMYDLDLGEVLIMAEEIPGFWLLQKTMPNDHDKFHHKDIGRPDNGTSDTTDNAGDHAYFRALYAPLSSRS